MKITRIDLPVGKECKVRIAKDGQPLWSFDSEGRQLRFINLPEQLWAYLCEQTIALDPQIIFADPAETLYRRFESLAKVCGEISKTPTTGKVLLDDEVEAFILYRTAPRGDPGADGLTYWYAIAGVIAGEVGSISVEHLGE